jgi:hypothetical protein
MPTQGPAFTHRTPWLDSLCGLLLQAVELESIALEKLAAIERDSCSIQVSDALVSVTPRSSHLATSSTHSIAVIHGGLRSASLICMADNGVSPLWEWW